MLHPSTHRIGKALISVSDKTGLIDFARKLVERDIQIISTGGTALALKEAGIPVVSIAEVTGFEEILDGRVKTLHPSIHAGLLAALDNPKHVHQLEANMIQSIDLVIVNLYPFEKTVENPASSHNDIIENIDIGGPAMIRASAKNYRWTAVVTNPNRYDKILSALHLHAGTLPEELRLELAFEAFTHTAHYDGMISQYFSHKSSSNQATTDISPASLPNILPLALRKDQDLRYGENPHQIAALYQQSGNDASYHRIFQYLHGKELSYNNLLDMDAAAKLALEFSVMENDETVVIIKHTNPCGVGSARTLKDAYLKAYSCDTTSAFGGIIAFTSELDLETAKIVDEIFTEVLIAPSYEPEALELLQQKKNRRLMTVNYAALKAALCLEIKAIAGGVLVQSADNMLWNAAEMEIVTKRIPSNDERQALEYAWRIAKHVKSNAIVYAAPDRALAIGAGQMSRVDSAAIAARKAEAAGISLVGSAVASDAFFPFADGLLETVKAGATAVIQPGGSVRDAEVIAAADAHGITMVCTGMRHFRH